MQTRRDQLQAYRFQNRRALAALVTGEPNVLEAPMRRLTVTTISGIMIAVLIVCVFAVIGFFKPDSGKAWKDAGAIIVVRDSPTIYVLLTDHKLHPVVNYASAVLAVSGKADPHVVYVDDSDLGTTARGATIGINYLPDTFPSAGDLIRSPWTVCSRQRHGESNDLQVRVNVYIGSTASATPLPSGDAVLARSIGGTDYVLVGGTRYPVGSARAAVFLMLQNASPVKVGTAFLNSVPAGPALAPPKIDGVGDPITAYTVKGATARVGDLLDVADSSTELIALSDGVATLTPLQAALLRAETQPGGRPVGTIPITQTDEASFIARQSKAPWDKIRSEFGDIPESVPTFSSRPATNGGICAEFGAGGGLPRFLTPPSQLPAYPSSKVSESAPSARGVADEVVIKPAGAALVQFAGQKRTVFFVAGPGEKYAAASTQALKGFGYAGVKPVQLPIQLEQLVPPGPAFDPSAALTAPTR